MASTKSKAQVEGETRFNLGRYDFKRADGTGDVLSVATPPSAYVLASRKSPLGTFEGGFWVAFYALKGAGALPRLDVDLSGCKDDEDRMLRVFDSYAFAYVSLNDDGTEAEGDGGPTGASA